MWWILAALMMGCGSGDDTSSEQGDDVLCSCDGPEAEPPDLCIDYARDEPVYADEDNDGFGDPEGATRDCSDVGIATNADDCDDTNDAVSPDAVEICDDDIDNDCDGDVDNNDSDCQA